MALHRLLFDVDNRLESANIGAYLRMGENGELVSYSNFTEAGAVSFVFVDGDVTTGTDLIAEVGHGLETGDIVRLTSTGTLPAGLALATNYYVIRVDADSFKLAANLADAEAGTAVDITDASSGGNHTVTQQERTHQAMDVNVVNAIAATISGTVPVTATDLDIRDLTHVSDSVKIGDGTDFLAIDASGNIGVTDAGGSLTVDASQLDIDDLNATDDAVSAWLKDGSGNSISSTAGSLDVNLTNASVVVSATNLDIRDLTHVSDSIKIGDGTDFLAIDASGNIGVTDAGGSLTVDAVQLDIDDLNATDDAVSSWLKDGSGNSITSSGGALDINIASSDIEINVEDDKANVAMSAASESVSTSAALLASPLAARRFLFLYNNGNKEIYIGPSGVTTGSGFPLFPGSLLEMRIGPAIVPHAVSAAGTQDIRSLQLS